MSVKTGQAQRHDLPDPLRARIAKQESSSAMDRVRHFLHSYVADSDGTDEMYAEIRRTVLIDAASIWQDLEAVETILEEEQVPGALLSLVVDDGNRGLNHPSDADAAAFLHALAQLLRSALNQS